MTSPDALPNELTILLADAARGDRAAFDRAFALLYAEMTALARAQRRRWSGNDTLGTSAIVHEAYLKLLGGDDDAAERVRWDGRRHFFALAAQVMRHVLVSYAERQRAAKRGGDATHAPLDDVADVLGDAPDESAEELLALHAALADLETIDARQARIVECRFFAGMSIPETADALGISPATVKRDWQSARDWIYERLRG